MRNFFILILIELFLAELDPKNKNYTIILQGERFQFLQMHFHWHGSEHELNGKHFPAELHMVHISLDSPVKKLAVVGVFLAIVEEDNDDLKPLVDGLKNIRDYKSETEIEFSLKELVPAQITNYYRYNGSLTTPTCDEIVIWNVVDSSVIIGVSEAQLIEFQTIRDPNGNEVSFKFC